MIAKLYDIFVTTVCQNEAGSGLTVDYCGSFQSRQSSVFQLHPLVNIIA